MDGAMMEVPFTLIVSVVISFIVSFVMIPLFNRYMHAAGITGTDVMKRDKPMVADMGGPGVITGFLAGIFFYVAVEIFIPPRLTGLIYILASLNTILIITLIGVFETLTSLMKKRDGEGVFKSLKRSGIPRWLYYFIPLPAAIPLSAVNAGVSKFILPIIGKVELGVIYPLILIPLAILCCSNATNFLAGFNGLEAGMGVVLHLALGLYAVSEGQTNAALIALTFVGALLAFLRYNWYPAQVFPGDLNYTIGAVCVCVTVLGNMEKYAILCFAPWILEAFLKAFSGFKAESYGVLQKNGVVKPLGKEIRGLTHLVMSLGEFTEKQVTTILIVFEVVVCFIAYILMPLI
jgi:UDP-N-acetylglucosamine--dolichyl-phosphate N-acetylglucosaminephosphotransferase